MAKLSDRFLFDFHLGGVVVLDCVATFRQKKCTSVSASFQGKIFDPDGIVIAWEDEFEPMAESLIHHAELLRYPI